VELDGRELEGEAERHPHGGEPEAPGILGPRSCEAGVGKLLDAVVEHVHEAEGEDDAGREGLSCRGGGGLEVIRMSREQRDIGKDRIQEDIAAHTLKWDTKARTRMMLTEEGFSTRGGGG
jgi:hypothetical protein